MSLLNTLLVSVLAIVTATLLGLLVGIMRLSSNWLVKNLALAFIEAVRCTPILVQLIWFYYALPILAGVEMTPITASALNRALSLTPERMRRIMTRRATMRSVARSD